MPATTAKKTPTKKKTPRYIAVEGPIGVGKTSLAKRLAAYFDGAMLLEQPGDNPFLERFYQQPRSAALPTQLFFLFQRARQLEELHQQDLFSAMRVADFMFEKDRLFARLTLDEAEYGLYEQVYAKLAPEAPTPDLVIYLQAPVDVLLERIARRGIRYEQHIERVYLEKLNEAYARFFHSYTGAPLLIVNAAQADFVNREQDFKQLVEQAQRCQHGRQYFNPAY